MEIAHNIWPSLSYFGEGGREDEAVCSLKLGIWSFHGVWMLEFGAFS
jgi:hypothetical protein